MLMFMEKPSKKLYPDYYKVIQEPIDMLTIENNIRAEKYTSEEEILNDFKVSFGDRPLFWEPTGKIVIFRLSKPTYICS